MVDKVLLRYAGEGCREGLADFSGKNNVRGTTPNLSPPFMGKKASFANSVL